MQSVKTYFFYCRTSFSPFSVFCRFFISQKHQSLVISSKVFWVTKMIYSEQRLEGSTFFLYLHFFNQSHIFVNIFSCSCCKGVFIPIRYTKTYINCITMTYIPSYLSQFICPFDYRFWFACFCPTRCRDVHLILVHFHIFQLTYCYSRLRCRQRKKKNIVFLRAFLLLIPRI